MPRRRWLPKVPPGIVFDDSVLLKNIDLAIVLLSMFDWNCEHFFIPRKTQKNGYIAWTRLDLLGHTWTQNWTNLDSLGGYSPGAACHYMKVLLYIQIRDMCWSLAAYMYRSNSVQISSSKALNAMYVDRPCCRTNSGGDDVQKHACQAFPWFFLETVRDRLGTVLGTVQRPLGFP